MVVTKVGKQTPEPTVYLCGPMVAEGQAPNGGYAAANARTLATLRAHHWPARGLPYPLPQGNGFRKLLAYVTGFRQLLAGLSSLQPGVLHVTGLYKQFAVPELLLIRKAKRLGFKTIYDIRAGSMLTYYRRLGGVYRMVFRSLLRSADCIMVEGREYEGFVQGVTGRTPFYFPNHIDVDASPARPRPAPGASPVMIYVGRVTLDKGIETVLGAARELKARGLDPKVWIVGPASSQLKNDVQAKFSDIDANWFGSMQANEVLSLLSQAHFFVFPSRHTGEGHSNALTEAMSKGCVPVVSLNGFNGSVVEEAGVVLPLQADGAAYAEAMLALWRGHQWADFSSRAQSRARASFDSTKVIRSLREQYQRLLEE